MIFNRMDYETWRYITVEDGRIVEVTGGHTPDGPRQKQIKEIDITDARELRRCWYEGDQSVRLALGSAVGL